MREASGASGHALVHGNVPANLCQSLARLCLKGMCRPMLLTDLGLAPTLNGLRWTLTKHTSFDIQSSEQ